MGLPGTVWDGVSAGIFLIIVPSLSWWIAIILGFLIFIYRYKPPSPVKPLRVGQFCMPVRYKPPASKSIGADAKLSNSLRGMIDHVLASYVNSWRAQISPHNSSFSDHVDSALSDALGNAVGIFGEGIDWPQFLVGRILPILTKHIQVYSRANAELKRTSQIYTRLSETDALQNRIASIYDSISPLHPYSGNIDPHLENLANTLSPMLVPANLIEYKPAINFINSLVGNAILKPLVNLLSNPDFLNQQVVKVVEKVLQDGANVHRLRQIVQLTLASELPPLTPKTDQEGYQEFITAVEKLESVALARQTHYSVSLLVQRLQHSDTTSIEFQKYLGRLTATKDLLEERIKQLDPHSLETDDMVEKLDFNSVISDSQCLSLFEEFIKCQEINYLDIYNKINTLDTSSVDPLGGFQMEATPLNPVNERKICEIYSMLHKVSSDVSPEIIGVFGSFVQDPSHDKYVQVQRESWKLRKYLRGKLELFVPDFKKSVYFEQYMAVAGSGRGTSVDRLQMDDINIDDEINHEIVQDAVLDAIGEAPAPDQGKEDDSFAGELKLLLGSDFQDFRPRIDSLTNEILELESQRNVLKPLLSKAELTNDINEMSILRKSTDSLQREINRKLLVKDQLVIRSTQSSFYKNFDISIVGNIQNTGSSGEFTSYLVQIKNIEKNDTWTISRRYKQFYALHKILRNEFDVVYQFGFPKKKMVLKFQQRQFIEARQQELNSYLAQLLTFPAICEHLALRMFLTSESFPGSYFDYASTEQKPRIEQDTFDDKGFAQPITEAFLTFFNIDEKNDWIRGKAIVIVVQQILGGTIEKRIRELGDSLPKHIPQLIDTAVESIWPDIPRVNVQRTLAERIHSRDHAKLLLKRILHIWLQRICGRSKCNYAAETSLGMLQNPVLNRHLVLTILDQIIDLLGSPAPIQHDSAPATPIL